MESDLASRLFAVWLGRGLAFAAHVAEKLFGRFGGITLTSHPAIVSRSVALGLIGGLGTLAMRRASQPQLRPAA